MKDNSVILIHGMWSTSNTLSTLRQRLETRGYYRVYRKNSKKAKIHLGFDLNHGIPSKISFTDGNGVERPFVDTTISAGQTAVADRGYQEHTLFDHLQDQGKHFIIRINANTTKTVIKENHINADSIVFIDAEVLLGTEENKNQSQKSLRLGGYHVDGVDYWITTDRRDLSAEQVAEAYKLRWSIENSLPGGNVICAPIT